MTAEHRKGDARMQSRIGETSHRVLLGSSLPDSTLLAIQCLYEATIVNLDEVWHGL